MIGDLCLSRGDEPFMCDRHLTHTNSLVFSYPLSEGLKTVVNLLKHKRTR